MNREKKTRELLPAACAYSPRAPNSASGAHRLRKGMGKTGCFAIRGCASKHDEIEEYRTQGRAIGLRQIVDTHRHNQTMEFPARVNPGGRPSLNSRPTRITRSAAPTPEYIRGRPSRHGESQ
jgi:hypothetical protein